MKHSQLLVPGPEALSTLAESVKRYYVLFVSAYPGTTVVFAGLPLLLAATGIVAIAVRLRRQRGHNVPAALLLLSTVIVACAAVPGASLLLENPVFVPRMFAAWGVTLLFCFYVSFQALPALRNWTAALAVVVLLYHLVLMVACFNSVVNSQRYQFSVMEQIKGDFYRLPLQSVDSLAFVGQLEDSPEVKNSVRNFPIIDSIRMKMLDEAEPWIWQALVAHTRTPEYAACVVNRTLVITFTDSTGK